MKSPDASRPIPLHDYGQALESAVTWLGDRYLLASPTPRRHDGRVPYFREAHRWHRSPPPSIERR